MITDPFEHLNELDQRCVRALEVMERRLRDGSAMFSGLLEEASGPLLVANVPQGKIGDQCCLFDPESGFLGDAEIVGFRKDKMLLAPFVASSGLSRRTEIISRRAPPRFDTSAESLGCVVDWRGTVIQRFADSARRQPPSNRQLHEPPPSLTERLGVTRVLATGVRCIDGLLTLGEGQRIGVFGQAGLGKSTLIDMIVQSADVDVVVWALVGERAREVVEAVSRIRTSDRAGCVAIVAATSDKPPVERMNAVLGATSLAESYRDAGLRVLLVVDSMTRVARAARDIGLARGEPPTRRGFPPSVFERLPPLFERAGVTTAGSITGLYCVLVDGEAQEDPVAEEIKSLVDGHISLSAEVASRGIYPAIDLVQSRSRVMDAIATPSHIAAANQFRVLSAAFDEVSLLVRVGEYRRGQDDVADRSLDGQPAMRAFMSQAPGEPSTFADTVDQLARLVA